MQKQSKTVYTASEARDNLYAILKDASIGLQTYEVTQRGGSPIVIMSKEEFNGWQETLDIMSNPDEYKAILKSLREKKKVPLTTVMKKMGLKDADLI